MIMGSKLEKEMIKYICRLMEKAIINALKISAGSRMENSMVLIPLFCNGTNIFITKDFLEMLTVI